MTRTNSNSRFTERDVPEQHGRTFLVTGANAGIGYETARVLARRGARVLMACRSQERAEQAIDQILDEAPHADLEFLPLDQADLNSIAAAVERIEQEERLDVLVNNAGVMLPPLSRTADGFELTFGVNHLGTFALTCQLLDKLAQTRDSRVVVTSSLAHKAAQIRFNDPNCDGEYIGWERYAMSKLANLLFALELDRRLRARDVPVGAVACHPGVASTEIARHLPGALQRFTPVIGRTLNTARRGAWPTLMAATWPRARSGDFYGPSGPLEVRGPGRKVRPAWMARDRPAAQRLWDLSVEMTGVDPGI